MATEGLRERKKQATREAIHAAALELFAQRGFDAVTVAEVARAADVAEKTVFNHFATKEDLVFPRGHQRLAALGEAIQDRPPGASVVVPFRDWTAAFLDRIGRGEGVEDLVTVAQLVRDSAALRNRLLQGWEEEAAFLTPIVAQAAGEDPASPIPAIMARTLAWVHRGIFRAALVRLIAGDEPSAIAHDLRGDAHAAYDLLEGGLAGYGVTATPRGG